MKPKSSLEIMMQQMKELAKEVGLSLKKPSVDPRACRDFAEKNFRFHESRLVCIVMDAINRKDSESLYQLARAVESRRAKEQREPADLLRMKILHLKTVVELTGAKWTLRQLAECIAGKRLDNPADGFSGLRRICKELKFPLAPSRQIRPGKRVKSIVVKPYSPSEKS